MLSRLIVVILCASICGTTDFVPMTELKITALERKLESLESREMPDLVQKVQDELTARMEEMSTQSKTRHDELSTKIQELLQRTLEQKEDTDKRLSGVEIKLEEISKTLQNEKERFLVMDNYLLMELREVQKKWDGAVEKVRSMEEDVKSALEMGLSKLEKLEEKENSTRLLIASHKATQRDVDAAIGQNITNLRKHVDESLSGIENGHSIFKRKMSNLANLISNLEKQCANTKDGPKLEENLQNLNKTTKDGLQSIRDEIKQLEQRGDLRDAEASEMQKALKNHTSQIGDLNAQLLDFLNSCSDPPPIINGHPVSGNGRLSDRRQGAVATYACETGRSMVGSGDLVCRHGRWTGVPPWCAKNCNTQDLKDYAGLDIPKNTMVEHSKTLDVHCLPGYVITSNLAPLTCNNGTWHVTADPCTGAYWDVTFYAEASYRSRAQYIECFSDTNADKIRFSRAIDTGSGEDLPRKAAQNNTKKSALLFLGDVFYPDFPGAYRCGFTTEEGTAQIVVPYQLANLHFLDRYQVASVEDTVSLQLSARDKSATVRWSRNGVPQWEDILEVDIVDATSDDAGIYSVRRKQDRADSAFLSLAMRKCKANLYGERCDQVCPPCYNGGICHDFLGVCVCQEGFVGGNCETPCPEGFHGADCSTPCADGDCKNRFYCKPEPYKCSCARGFKGLLCDEKCKPGWYGADCMQPCHCVAGGESCNRFTGACAGGCAQGWKGESCQIKDA